jgi:hypothetical protein
MHGMFLSQAPLLKRLVAIFVALRALYAAVLTGAQYWVWAHAGVEGRIFIDSPIIVSADTPSAFRSFLSLFDFPHGYFVLYAFDHFWFGLILSLAVSFAFYGILLLVNRHRIGAFSTSEVLLGLLGSLIVGWPGAVIFIPLALLIAIIFQASGMLAGARAWMRTLHVPFLIALGILLAWRIVGDPVAFFGLSVLKV